MKKEHGKVSRRDALKSGLVAAVGASAGISTAEAEARDGMRNWRITNGRIRQSIMGWTYKHMEVRDLALLCKDIGMEAMEGVDIQHYPMIRELGLNISLVSSHSFKTGPVSKANHPMVIQTLMERIDIAAEVGAPGVITFTGMKEEGLSHEESAKNCVDCWKQVIGHAEKKKVNLVFEHLNSRDNTHPMKGHPGYFGDDVDFCIELVKRVGSPNFKLLFDIYHVQIMNGDVIRRIGMYKDYIAHYHTAGVPGRGEIDENQEVSYPAIMRAILDTGYTGYVAQEFIPTWEDTDAALRHACKTCDV